MPTAHVRMILRSGTAPALAKRLGAQMSALDIIPREYMRLLGALRVCLKHVGAHGEPRGIGRASGPSCQKVGKVITR